MVENELQKKFGVSRSTIRESFRILEKNGFVVNVPRKGTFIREFTKRYIEENFPIRAVLEGLAARLAISYLGTEDIQRMELTLLNMTEAANNNDFKSYLKFHFEYHMIYINSIKNDTLIEILENLLHHVYYPKLMKRKDGSPEETES